MGLFNTAEAYRLSATALPQIKHGHAEMPRRFLYYHALELYLKALLRQQHDIETVRNSFGHKIDLLVREAEALGLFVGETDRKVLARTVDTDAMIDSRYIRRGSKSWGTLEELRRTCNSIRDDMRAAAQKWLADTAMTASHFGTVAFAA
jgi:HEPN domain-containing protein